MFVYNNPLLYLHDHYYPVESIIYILYYVYYVFVPLTTVLLFFVVCIF